MITVRRRPETMAALAAQSVEAARDAMRAARRAAFAAEADPLFFKMARGEATMAEYEAKIDEIRSRYPYPALPSA